VDDLIDPAHSAKAEMEWTGITLVNTPIGNLQDLTPRAAKILASADVWLVEDTRVSGKLNGLLGVKKPMRLVTDHSSDHQLEKLVEEARAGIKMALITDGGAPGISDPGARLADLAHEAKVNVDVAPGVSAPTAALTVSGFYAQRFAFLGFLPRKPGPMQKELEVFRDSPYTLVVFESPHRLENLLNIAAKSLGNRRFAICRELTKLHQQIFRSELPYIPTPTEVPRKGEITVVFEGIRRLREADDE
jgi:16S rRNA (cytidine1402-2'-O)-methyltransferase